MPARFDDWIPYFRDDLLDDVIAIGPLHSDEKLKEVCAWIYQPTSIQGRDAAATEMHFENGRSHPDPGAAPDPPHFQQVEGVRWLLPLRRISKAEFEPGQAFAVAVALVVDMNAPTNERVVWWGQPVDLFESKASVLAARKDDALHRDPLKNPAPPHTTA